MEVRMKVRIDGVDDAGATRHSRHDSGTTMTRGRGSDKQGRRCGDDAATTGRNDEATT